MADYKHGAYGIINAVGARAANESSGVIVYVGTAPVHTVEGGADYVNKPILVNNIGEARAYFGYSEDWASYTLCEAMYVHLENKGIGPIVMINVLDPAVHKKAQGGTTSVTPANGKLVIASAASIILDSVEIKTQDQTPVTKEKGVDYTISYDWSRGVITATELSPGSLGTAALTVTYDIIDPTVVTNADVIGSSDGLGLNKGTYAVKDVYQLTQHIPSFLAAPGFSSVPAIHSAMYENSVKINGHWDAYMFVDLPIVNGGTPLTFDTIQAYKNGNGYTKENESVYFPLALGVDGRKYHISVLAAANFQELLSQNNGIPFNSASNTECVLIENLYLGEAYKDRIFDDYIINAKLNKNGINSAAYVGGRWAIWGAHSADYSQTNADSINVAETNRMMLYYISNDFQHRRTFDIDKPTTPNSITTIVIEEQRRIDALVQIGALIFGEVLLNADYKAKTDILNGDFSFMFRVTTTPLAKSLTAIVTWVDDGFVTYFEDAA